MPSVGFVPVPSRDLEGCAALSRALLWTPELEVAGVSAQTPVGLGPVLMLARGSMSCVRVPPTMFFGPLIAAGATGGVLVHTHRADGPPTREDLAVTRRLVAGGALLGVPLVAHLVVGPMGWWDAIDPAAGQRGYPVGLGYAA